MSPLILSLCGVVRERLLPCRVVVTAKWVVSCTRITCIQPLSHCSLMKLPPLSFQKKREKKMDDGVARFFTRFGGNLFIC